MICMTSTWKSYIFLNRRRDFYGFRTDELKLALMFYCIFSCVRIRWFPISLIHMRKSNALPHVPSALNFRRDCDSTSFIHDSVQTLQTSYRKSIYLSFVNMHRTIADESKFMDSIWVQLFFILFHFFVFSLFLSRHRKTIYHICQFIDAIHVRKREREFKLQLTFGCNSQVIYIRKCHFCSALKITFATILHAIMICSSGFECILPSIASHIYRMPCEK